MDLRVHGRVFYRHHLDGIYSAYEIGNWWSLQQQEFPRLR